MNITMSIGAQKKSGDGSAIWLGLSDTHSLSRSLVRLVLQPPSMGGDAQSGTFVSKKICRLPRNNTAGLYSIFIKPDQISDVSPCSLSSI